MKATIFLVLFAVLFPYSSNAQVVDSLVAGPSVQVGQDQTVPVTVSCPTGYTVVSGGWEAYGGSNQLFVPRSLPSNSTLNEWEFNFRNNGASTTTVNTFIIVRRVTANGIEDILDEMPNQYSLSQNYPNPFNPTTTIIYQLPKTSKVSLTIYNIIGQKIKALINEKQSAGKHTVTWDGLDQNGQHVSSGIYLFRLQTYDFIKTYKMLVVR